MKPKLILISGVTRGLGHAMTEEFIRLGHRVLGCGRSAGAIEELNRQYGPDSCFEVVDVTQDEEVRRWAQRCLELAGPPDLLLNSAALINRNAPLWEVPAAEFSTVIDVNIKGVANLIRHFAPAMVERKHGVIVNFSSGWSRPTAPPSGRWKGLPRRWRRSCREAWPPSR
jgi:NAD(P)-dependent dehydrogenase (short-subunit alcohol dehydrogenase family)